MQNENQLIEIKAQSQTIQEMVENTTITNEEELGEVSDKIKKIKEFGKIVKAEKEKLTKPANEIIKEARAKYLPYEKLCKEAEDKLKAKAGDFMMKQEQERIKKEESIARRAENGQLKEGTAVRKMEELGEEKKSVSTGNSQIQRRTIKKAYIVDEKLIPKEYWIVDEAKVKKVALAGVEIPGVEVREESSIAVR